jgi:hypothetical protein
MDHHQSVVVYPGNDVRDGRPTNLRLLVLFSRSILLQLRDTMLKQLRCVGVYRRWRLLLLALFSGGSRVTSGICPDCCAGIL